MFGPFLDKTDGVTLEVGAGIITSIDHAATGIFLSKNGAAGAIRHAAVTASVLDAYGMFQVHLDTTDTDTCGNLRVMMAEAATFLPVWDDYLVLPANVYDSLVGSDLLDVNAAQWLGTAILAPGTAGTPDVNAKLIGATAQTGRDLGTSVLLSSGTGTGQLDFTSGVVKANLWQYIGTAFGGTAAQIVAAFQKFFDKATPTGTINSLPDAVAGAPGGLFIAGTNAATSITTALTANIIGNITGTLATVTAVTNAVAANLTQILGTALTETAGLLAGAFKKFFNVAAPTATCLSLPDAVPGAVDGLPTTNGTKVSQTVDLTASQIVFKKNVARANFAFPMFDSTGALKTGLTVTAAIRKDAGAAFAALAGSVTEIGATGWYTVDWAQAETNADTIAFSASAAGANPTTMTLLTQA